MGEAFLQPGEAFRGKGLGLRFQGVGASAAAAPVFRAQLLIGRQRFPGLGLKDLLSAAGVYAQLRRDILEKMPRGPLSMEALECHIRCHPVGPYAATCVFSCPVAGPPKPKP